MQHAYSQGYAYGAPSQIARLLQVQALPGKCIMSLRLRGEAATAEQTMHLARASSRQVSCVQKAKRYLSLQAYLCEALDCFSVILSMMARLLSCSRESLQLLLLVSNQPKTSSATSPQPSGCSSQSQEAQQILQVCCRHERGMRTQCLSG